MNVPIITESQIEATAESLVPDQLEETLVAFGKDQPAITAYLLSDSFSILLPQERELLLYLAMIIWQTITSARKEVPVIGEETWGSAEEKNWGLFDEAKGKKFRDKMDVFFADTPQEDLLAYVEDALVLDPDDEENFLTPEGRVPISVALKTMIDLLAG
jgi:hypothetical protein